MPNVNDPIRIREQRDVFRAAIQDVRDAYRFGMRVGTPPAKLAEVLFKLASEALDWEVSQP